MMIICKRCSCQLRSTLATKNTGEMYCHKCDEFIKIPKQKKEIKKNA